MNYSLYKKHNLPQNRIIPVHVCYANFMTLLEGFCEMKEREKLMSGVLKLTGHLPAAAIAPLEIKSATRYGEGLLTCKLPLPLVDVV